jgi:hypothetical protein
MAKIILNKLVLDRLSDVYRKLLTNNSTPFMYLILVPESTLTVLTRINAELAKGQDGIFRSNVISNDLSQLQDAEGKWLPDPTGSYGFKNSLNTVATFNAVHDIFSADKEIRQTAADVLVSVGLMTSTEATKIVNITRVTTAYKPSFTWAYDEATKVDIAVNASPFEIAPAYDKAIDNPTNEQLYFLSLPGNTFPSENVITLSYEHAHDALGQFNIVYGIIDGGAGGTLFNSIKDHTVIGGEDVIVSQITWAAWSLGLVGSNADIEFDHLDYVDQVDSGLTIAILRPTAINCNI